MKKFKNLKRNLDIQTSPTDDILTLSFASDKAYFRESGDYGYYQILQISQEAINFERLVNQICPLLLNHNEDQQIGVVEKAYIADGKLKAEVRFSSSDFAQQIRKDITDGIRRNTSLGYMIDQYEIVKNENDFDTVIAKRWSPYQLSIVACPADFEVGYQRNLNIEDTSKMEEETKETLIQQELLEEEIVEETTEETIEEEVKAVEEEKETEAEVVTNEDVVDDIETITGEQEVIDDSQEITALAKLTGEEDLAEEFLKSSEEKSLKNFKTFTKNYKLINKEPKKMEKYSISKAIRSVWKGEQATYETNVTLNAKKGLAISDHDIFVPKAELKRALTPAANSGGALIGTDYLPQDYAELYRSDLSLDKTGFYTITSDGNPVSFARMLSGATAAMYAIDGQLTDAEPAFSLVTLTPKKAGCCVPVPFSLILQGRPEVDAIIEEDITSAIRELRDKMCLVGTGSNNQPTGIYNTTGVNEIAPSAIFSWEGVCEAEGLIRENNIFGKLYWVMNANDKATFEATAKNDNEFLCEDGFIKGHEVVINNALADGQIILGDFRQLAVCDFGPLKIKVDDISLAKKQAIQLIVDAEFDCAVRRPGAFTVVKN